MDNGGSCYRGARIARRGATLETLMASFISTWPQWPLELEKGPSEGS